MSDSSKELHFPELSRKFSQKLFSAYNRIQVTPSACHCSSLSEPQEQIRNEFHKCGKGRNPK